MLREVKGETIPKNLIPPIRSIKPGWEASGRDRAISYISGYIFSPICRGFMSSPPLFTDREGVLLVAGLLLRAAAKGYTPEVVREALATSNRESFNELEATDAAETVTTVASGMAQGVLLGAAEILEGLSKVSDEHWLKTVHAAYAAAKAEEA